MIMTAYEGEVKVINVIGMTVTHNGGQACFIICSALTYYHDFLWKSDLPESPSEPEGYCIPP